METLIAATLNEGKAREFESILGGLYAVKTMRACGLALDVEETGTTFEQNAIIKARAIFEILKAPVISDDSGLVVEALNGEPGIYSARYFRHGDDEGNIQKLLANMKNIANRAAKFVSCVAMIDSNGRLFTSFGEVEGEILREKRGTGGFGYDAVFYSPEIGKTFAEAALAEKNEISHRKRALMNLLESIKQARRQQE